MFAEPEGALMCHSSTPAVLADSGPIHGLLLTVLVDSGMFRGLLLTVMRSRSDFHDCRFPRCVDVSVINTRSFGRFWPVSWTITHRFGVPERFSRLTIPGVR